MIPSVIHVAALDPFLDRNPLYLVERDFISPPVVQLRRPGRFMMGDMLRHFQLATVLKIRGDAGSAEGMIADLRLDAGGFSRVSGSCGRRLAGAWGFP